MEHYPDQVNTPNLFLISSSYLGSGTEQGSGLGGNIKTSF